MNNTRADVQSQRARRDRLDMAISSIITLVFFGTSAYLSWDYIGEHPWLSAVLMMCFIFPASVKIHVSYLFSEVTLSLAGMALAVVAMGAENVVAIYAVWLVGSFLGSAWFIHSFSDVLNTTSRTSLAGAAMLATMVYAPIPSVPIPVIDPRGEALLLAASFGAYLVTLTLLFPLTGYVVDKTDWRTSMGSIGLTRAFTIVGLEYLGIVAANTIGGSVANTYALSMGAVRQLSLVVLLFLTAIVAITMGIRRARVTSTRELQLVEAVNSMPWPVTTPIGEQAMHYVKNSMPEYSVRLEADDVFSPDDTVRGKVIASSVITEGNQPYRLVVARKVRQRPLSSSDRNFLEAIASVARESLRVHHEIQRLDTLSNTDDLTGIPNYRAFRIAVHRLSEETTTDGLVAIIYIDADNFKMINDNYGHPVGNVVLRTIAKRLTDAVGPHDMVARVGGDEFAILVTTALSETDVEEKSLHIGDVVNEPVDVDGMLIPISITQGISYSQHGRSDLSRLMEEADERMYAARGKRLGVLADEDENERRIATEAHEHPKDDAVSALQAAIVDNRLTQVYQPIFDYETKELVAIEALVRYTDPELGPMSVPFILHEAHRLGLSSRLSIDMVSQSLKDFRRFRRVMPELRRLHININVEQLVNYKFRHSLEEHLDHNPDVTIVLELHEVSLRTVSDEVAEHADAYAQRKNLTLAIDDVGTDYSELFTLTRFPIQMVKVDKRVVGAYHNQKTAIVLTNLLALGEQMGFETVFEGVETAQQVEFLSGIGARYMQGYVLSRPIAANELVSRLETMGLTLA